MRKKNSNTNLNEPISDKKKLDEAKKATLDRFSMDDDNHRIGDTDESINEDVSSTRRQTRGSARYKFIV